MSIEQQGEDRSKLRIGVAKMKIIEEDIKTLDRDALHINLVPANKAFINTADSILGSGTARNGRPIPEDKRMRTHVLLHDAAKIKELLEKCGIKDGEALKIFTCSGEDRAIGGEAANPVQGRANYKEYIISRHHGNIVPIAVVYEATYTNDDGTSAGSSTLVAKAGTPYLQVTADYPAEKSMAAGKPKQVVKTILRGEDTLEIKTTEDGKEKQPKKYSRQDLLERGMAEVGDNRPSPWKKAVEIAEGTYGAPSPHEGHRDFAVPAKVRAKAVTGTITS